MTLWRFMRLLWHLLSERGDGSADCSGSRVGIYHLCNDMGRIPVIEKLYKNASPPTPPPLSTPPSPHFKIMTEAAALQQPFHLSRAVISRTAEDVMWLWQFRVSCQQRLNMLQRVWVTDMGSRGSVFIMAVALCLLCKYPDSFIWKMLMFVSLSKGLDISMRFPSSGLTGAARPDVRGKAGGVVELPCNFPTSTRVGEASSAPLRVVEWVRQGLDSPVLMKFGSYKPRIHPDYEGECWYVDVGIWEDIFILIIGWFWKYTREGDQRNLLLNLLRHQSVSTV